MFKNKIDINFPVREFPRKISLIFFAVFFSFQLFSQQQKQEVYFSLTAGGSSLLYDLNIGNSALGLGGLASVGYRYFLSSSAAVSLGLEYAHYNGVFSANKLKNRDQFNDSDFGRVDYEVSLTDYKETQCVTALNIPLMLYFQTSGVNRVYTSFGVKLSVPQTTHFKQSPLIQVKTTGYAPEYNLHLIDAEFLGYGEFKAEGVGRQDYSEFGVRGKMNCIASCEIGLKFCLSKYFSVYTAAYLDYGVTPMLKFSADATNYNLLSGVSDLTQEVEFENAFTINPILISRYDNKQGETLPIMKREKVLPFLCGIKISLSFGVGKRYDLEKSTKGLYKGYRWWMFQ